MNNDFFRLEIENGIATIWIDSKNDKMNIVSPSLIGDFEEVFNEVNQNKQIQGAILISAKKDFTQHNWKGRNILLFGSEGFGIKTKTLENSDFKFKVNMNNNIESLNISNTVSVVCHHVFQSIK